MIKQSCTSLKIKLKVKFILLQRVPVKLLSALLLLLGLLPVQIHIS